MNPWRAAFAVAVLFPAGAAVGVAGDGIRATAPRVLRVCVVDEARNSAADAAFQQAFAQRMGQFMGAETERAEISAERVGGRAAAERLKTRTCDAVLVLGADRPRALRVIDAVAFAGTLGWERNGVPVYLIVGNQDAAFQRTLAEAFRAAICADGRERKVAAR